MKKFCFHIISLLFFVCLQAQEAPINVLFVVDASSSMLKRWGKEDKWSIAEKSLLEMADSLTAEHSNLEFGLRVYGHQSLPIDNNCEDTELKLAIGNNSLEQLEDRLISVKPKGITPLAFTLEQTKKDFAGKEGQKNILILITDGSESCLGDPCAILDILLKHQVIVKPVIIGLDIDIESLRAYHCIQDIFNPQNPDEFKRRVLQVVRQAINFTTLQVHLLDESKNSLVSNVPMLFYANKKEPAYHFYHKLNENNLPDTLLIEPSQSYTLEVQTIPPIVKDNIELKGNVHNEIYLDAPICALRVQSYKEETASALIPAIPYFIKKAGSQEYIYKQECNNTQNYLYGSYDIDILTLPIIRLKNVVLESSSKEIKIEAPGKLVVNARFPIHAALFTEINNELVNIYTFKANSTQEILDLQPGEYSLIYRFNHKRKMVESEVEKIQIKSKEIVELNL